MIRIFIIIQLVCASLLLATCERANMYDLAKYGLPPQLAIYLFPISQQAGNFGSRTEADNLCYRQGIAYHTLVNAGTVKAFVSFSMVDELRFLVPVQYWHYPVMGISSTLDIATISSSWLDLLQGAPAAINASLGIPTNFWTGSNTNGSLALNENCSGWNTSDSGTNGRFGGIGINDGFTACSDTTLNVLCIAY